MHPYYHGGMRKQTAINWINVQELGCLLFIKIISFFSVDTRVCLIYKHISANRAHVGAHLYFTVDLIVSRKWLQQIKVKTLMCLKEVNIIAGFPLYKA